MPHYALRSADVTHETFDGELVVVDLETGAYYSANASAATIWQCLIAGMNEERAATHLIGKSSLDEKVEAVRGFAARLVAERLLVTASADALTESLIEVAQTTYADPTLTRYDDLQELLLLDPVHDVDEIGWPAVNARKGKS